MNLSPRTTRYAIINLTPFKAPENTLPSLKNNLQKNLTEEILSQARQSRGSTRGGGRRFPDRPLASTTKIADAIFLLWNKML